jgi:plasmid stabilization system protein ParE
MSGFRLTRRAERDVAEIYSYIARDNVSAAERLVSDLFGLF